MDFRRIIKFGNSSYVVSLPKTWIVKNNLKKGDLLYYKENNVDSLILTTKEKEDPIALKEITIPLYSMNSETIQRYVYSKYLAGFDVITLVGEKEIRTYEKDIREILNNLIAFEIVEQTKGKLVVKDFIVTGIVIVSPRP